MKRRIKDLIILGILVTGVLTAAGCSKEEKEEEPEKVEALSLELPEEKEETDGGDETDAEAENSGETSDTKETAEETEEEQTPEKKGILVSIDPGHQSPNVDMSAQEPNAPGSSTMKTKATGGTSGRYSGIPEYQLNLDISLMLRDALEEEGYDVVMTREDNDTAISNAERATLANEAGADFAVRIHANGSENSGANGALVLIGSAQNAYVGNLYEQSYALGQTVLNSYCETTGMQNLGVQANDTMTGINWSQVPVIILEMGFMTNETDDLNMADEAYRAKMVEGIVKGIDKYCEENITD